jgi:invasion protein IalB
MVRSLGTGLALTIALTLSSAGFAVADTATGSPQRTTATYDDWLMQCQAQAVASAEAAKDPAAPAVVEAEVAKPEMACEINQTFTVRETGATLAKLAIGRVAGPTPGTKAILLTPMGVYLPDGSTLKIDTAAEIKGLYTFCNAQACISEFDLTDELVQQLKSATTVGITFTMGDRKPLSLNVSTKGLASAYDASLTAK